MYARRSSVSLSAAVGRDSILSARITEALPLQAGMLSAISSLAVLFEATVARRCSRASISGAGWKRLTAGPRHRLGRGKTGGDQRPPARSGGGSLAQAKLQAGGALPRRRREIPHNFLLRQARISRLPSRRRALETPPVSVPQIPVHHQDQQVGARAARWRALVSRWRGHLRLLRECPACPPVAARGARRLQPQLW